MTEDSTATEVAAWRRAATWRERREAIAGGAADRVLDPEDGARARRRIERWRSESPFDDPAWWDRRRAADDLAGLDDNDLVRSLIEPPADVPLAWVERLTEIYRRPSDGPRPGGIFCAVEPLLGDGRRRLRSRHPSLEGSDLEVDLIRLLAERLHRRMVRSLVLELQIAQLDEGRLDAPTPEARFDAFHHGLRDRERALAWLETVPVLARGLVAEVDRWLVAVDELLCHLDADRARLIETCFGGVDPGPAVAVGATGSDPHRGGRVVLCVRFASGRRLAYKPRSMAPEVAFSAILDALADDLGDDTPWQLPVLDRDDHGWMAWVEPRPCRDDDEIERFYRRQGVLLAVLHALGTTDLHHENLIAVGDQPVLVDLETLAHPVLPGAPSDASRPAEVDASGLDESVLRVGLLPHRLLVGDEALDPSGLGADADQAVGRGGWRFEGAGTDRMQVVQDEGTLGDTPGRPTLGDQAVDPLDHVEGLREGFRRGRRALRRAVRRPQASWLADDGPLPSLWQAPVRVVLRPTRAYALLLSESFHPHHLSDAIDRDLLFERLWLGVRRQPLLAAVVAAERRDLARGDIPCFTTRVDSRHLWDADGRDLGALLPESAADGIRRRLAALDACDDEARQIELIDAAFELRAAEQGRRPRPRSTVDPEQSAGGRQTDPGRLVDLACRAGDRLAALAFRGRHGARWWAPRRLASNRWTLVEAGPDLYYGVSGIALFLAALAEVSGEPRYGELADEATATLLRSLAIEDPALRDDLGLRSAGAFDGLGGMVYALVHLAHWRRRPELVDQAKRLLDPLAEAVEADTHHDIVSGTAGALVAVARLAAIRPSSTTRRLIARCADRLVERADATPAGSGWRPAVGDSPPLAGIAHGVAGIAWALAEAGGHRGTIERALDYEDTLFAEAAGNWRDLRPRPEWAEERFLTAWCHGAAGIGLARVALADADPKLAAACRDRIARDIDRAIETTLTEGFGLGHSLCHGDLGNLDCLLEIARARGDAALRRRIDALALQVADSLDAQGFLFGTPGGTRPPGAMVGLAGIGYGLLRLAAPRKVPSWLRLAPCPAVEVEPPTVDFSESADCPLDGCPEENP